MAVALVCSLIFILPSAPVAPLCSVAIGFFPSFLGQLHVTFLEVPSMPPRGPCGVALWLLTPAFLQALLTCCDSCIHTLACLRSVSQPRISFL